MAFSKRTIFAALQLLLLLVACMCVQGADAKKDQVAVKHGQLRKQLITVEVEDDDDPSYSATLPDLLDKGFSGKSDEYAGTDSADINTQDGAVTGKDTKANFVRGEELTTTKTKYKNCFVRAWHWLKTKMTKAKKYLADNEIEVGINWKIGAAVGISVYADFKQQKLVDKYPSLKEAITQIQNNKWNEISSGIFKGSVALVPNLKLEVGIEIKLLDQDYDGTVKLKFKIFDLSWLQYFGAIPPGLTTFLNIKLYFCFMLVDLPSDINQDWGKAIKLGLQGKFKEGLKVLWDKLKSNANYQLGTEAEFTIGPKTFNPVVFGQKHPLFDKVKSAPEQNGDTVPNAPVASVAP